METSTQTMRPYRSKSQRPCDRCRRRKTVCIIQDEGPCQSCVKADHSCNFEMPPAKRRRGPDWVSTSIADSEEVRADRIRNETTDRSEARSPPVYRSPSHGPGYLLGEIESAGAGKDHDDASAFTISSPAVARARVQDRPTQYASPSNGVLNSTSPLNQVTTSQSVQYICSLDQIDGATAQFCGSSAELDPWLLRHCRYNEYGMRRLQGIHIRNVGGVPIQGLVPVHFTVVEDSLPDPAKVGTAPGSSFDPGTRQHELLMQLVPFTHGIRLINLFLTFIYPAMPIISQSQLGKQLTDQNIPAVLLAAIYASALPYIAHDHVLFVLDAYNESLGDRLWRMVYEQVHEELHSPKLAVIQASLLYLQRLPSRHRRILGDTPSRPSFLGSTVALAMSLGLHLEPRPWGIPMWEKRLRRRLWWAVFMEDKWTSLLLGRPPLIRQDEWDIWDLEETDLDCDEDIAALISLGIQWPEGDIIFPHFIKLSRLVERIHQTFYTLRSSQRLSEDFRASIEAARPIRESLQAWYSGLPEDLRLKSRLEGHLLRDRRQGVAALHFSYLTLELFLYRAILRPLARSPPPPPVSREGPSSNHLVEPIITGTSASPWYLDDLTLDNFELDQLPSGDFSEFGKAAEATLNAAEKCAGIIINFIATLVPQDFDILWYPWTRICFATVTSFITLLFVQAPTPWHAARSKELLDRWSVHLRCQHKSHEALMTLGLVRLHSFEAEELDRMFVLSPSASEVLRGGLSG